MTATQWTAARLDKDLSPWVVAAAGGDTQAFGRLVDASCNTVASISLAICRDPQTSEDVAQEVYLVAWRRLAELRNPRSFLPWIRQITRFTAKTWMRDRRSADRHLASSTRRFEDDESLDSLLQEAADPRTDPESSLLDQERLDILYRTLDLLPDESREVVILYYREGRSTQQVARLLSLSEAAVRKRLQRARQELRRETLEQFAEVARKSAPGAAFTAAVMAAAGAAPTVSAAGLTVASGHAGAGSKLFALLGGIGLGFIGGAAGVVLGLQKDFRDAADDWERNQLRALRNTALLAVLVTCIGFTIPALHTHWLGPVTLFAAFLATLGTLYLHWLPSLLRRRFMIEEAGNLEAVEQRLAARSRGARLGMILGGLCGLAGLLAGLWSSGLI